MNKRTILVIDDERDLADLVRRSLEAAGFDVILAEDGTSGLEIAKAHRPDLVVLDLSMPGIDGLEVCQRLRRDPRHAHLPIIVLSARASAVDRVLGLELGADDYLIKPFLPRELVARINAVLRRPRGQTTTPPVIRIGYLLIDIRGHQVSYRGKPILLTAAEFKILEFLATQVGQVFSRDEILEGALHRDMAVTERTVDAHIVGIRKALGSSAEFIETVRGIGYCFRAAPADDMGQSR